MKITRLETLHIRPRWMVLKVHTDVGIVGLGEPTLEGRARTIAVAVQELEPVLIGQDPRRIEFLWQQMYRGTFYRGGPILSSAISGVEQALWDILGKSLNTPVWQLLGGQVRDRIRVYGWVHAGKDEDYLSAAKRSIKDKQFTAYKIGPLGPSRMIDTPAAMEKAAAQVAALREAAGNGIDIAVDLHGRATPALAKRFARMIEPYHPMFIEEPVLPGDTAALLEISRSTTIPIATGERLFTRWGFQDVIGEQAVAIVQPDLSHVGGIFEARKVAAMAESRNIAVAPHCPLGPVALAACLQLDACTPNFLCQEHVTLGQGYLKTPFKVEAGYIAVPQGPGLGIELDEAALQGQLFDGDWQTPQWRLEDGSVAEW